MKILFFSDIHGLKKNLNKLKNIIDKEKPDKIVALGDLYYLGFNGPKKGMFDNKAVYAFLNSYQDRLIIIKGNQKLSEMFGKNISESLKDTNPLEWVGKINNIKNKAEEIILKELIYV